MSAQASDFETQLAHSLASRLDRRGRAPAQETADDPPEMQALLATFERAQGFVEDPQPEFFWRLGQTLRREAEGGAARGPSPRWWASLRQSFRAQPRLRLGLAGTIILLLVLLAFGRSWSNWAGGTDARTTTVADGYRAYSAVSALDAGSQDHGTTTAAKQWGLGLPGWTATYADTARLAPALLGQESFNIAPVTAGDRMVIRRAALDLAVPDVMVMQARLENLISAHGGIIIDAQITRSADGQAISRVSIQVPHDSLEAMLADLHELGATVLAERIVRSDVTSEHADLAARIHNLQAAEAELLELLEESRARNYEVGSILNVYNSVSNLRGQIEQLQAQQAVMEESIAMAQIDVALLPEPLAPEEPEVPGFAPERVLAAAWAQMVIVLQWLATGLIWLAVFLPLPLLTAGVFWAVYRVRSARRARRTQPAAGDKEPGQ